MKRLSKSKSSDTPAQKRPRLAVTPGEPAGIGPDICLQSFAQTSHIAELVYYVDPGLMLERARMLNLDIPMNDIAKSGYQDGAMNIRPVSLLIPVMPGQPASGNAAYLIETLDLAVTACESGELDGMVTGPLNKAVINEGGIPFSGHTEWLAERTGAPRVVMMLAGDSLRVALATTHLPLSGVSRAITKQLLTDTLTILHDFLVSRSGISKPRILVCGLNPHAGENGHLGTEEIDTIIPVIRALQQQGMQLEGPLPADTLFTPANLARGDAVLAMYHDQGLPVLKHVTFGQGVNITLGLPIIRTSVDHGTAFDLAGSGRADCSSLIAAINYAAKLSRVSC